MTDDELKAELANSDPGSRVYEHTSGELNRRYLDRARLHASSNRVERLTVALVILTIILIVLAAPPAWESLKSLLGR